MPKMIANLDHHEFTGLAGGKCLHGMRRGGGVSTVCDRYADHTVHSAQIMAPGWSKAARGHGAGSRSHPLGRLVHAGDGFTEYADDELGGTVQIWNES